MKLNYDVSYKPTFHSVTEGNTLCCVLYDKQEDFILKFPLGFVSRQLETGEIVLNPVISDGAIVEKEVQSYDDWDGEETILLGFIEPEEEEEYSVQDLKDIFSIT